MMWNMPSRPQASSFYCPRPSRNPVASPSALHNLAYHRFTTSALSQPQRSQPQQVANPAHQQQQQQTPWHPQTNHHQQQQQQTRSEAGLSTFGHAEQQQQIEALQKVLQIPLHRAQHIADQASAILLFEPQTLRITIDTLCEVLHLNYHTVVGVIEQRPGILLCPDEPVMVQQQLAVLLGITPWRVADLLGTKYAHLLALAPQQLEARCTRLCDVMYWRKDDLQTAAQITGPEAFIHLLSTPTSHTASQLAALAAALDCAEAPAAVAAVVQHYPRLLDRRDYLLWPQLKLMADTAGVTARRLLSELDSQQCKGLSGVLLYEPVWIRAQLRSLARLLKSRQSHDDSYGSNAVSPHSTSDKSDAGGRMLVWLLCRLATPNRLAMAKARMQALQTVVAAYQPWQDELQHADDVQLSVMLTASDEAMQQLQFLVDTGRESVCGLSLVDVLSCSEDDWRRKYGLVFEEWSATHDKKIGSAAV